VCGKKGFPSTSSAGQNDVPRLPCDDECETQQRNARLRDALEIAEREKGFPQMPFPRVLLEQIVEDDLMGSLEKIEAQFRDFMVGDQRHNATLNFRPMKQEQRWLIHQLAVHYGLKSESMDSGIHRSVRLLRTPLAVMPPMTLTDAVKRFAQDPTSVRTADSHRLLFFYDLTSPPRVGPADLRGLLSPFDGLYRLNFIDQSTAVAVFTDVGTLEQVRKRCTRLGFRLIKDPVYTPQGNEIPYGSALEKGSFAGLVTGMHRDDDDQSAASAPAGSKDAWEAESSAPSSSAAVSWRAPAPASSSAAAAAASVKSNTATPVGSPVIIQTKNAFSALSASKPAAIAVSPWKTIASQPAAVFNIGSGLTGGTPAGAAGGVTDGTSSSSSAAAAAAAAGAAGGGGADVAPALEVEEWEDLAATLEVSKTDV